MQRARHILFMLAVLAIYVSSAKAKDSSPDLNELLDLLVAKKVITAEEAAAFRAGANARTETANVASQNNAAVASAVVLPVPLPPASPSAIATSSGSTLRFNGYVQGRWTGAPATTNSFEIRRARISASGNVGDQISYLVQADGVRPQLLDARVDFNPSRALRFTVGQFKIPFSTENITSDNELLFVERSTVVNNFAPGRDNGSNNGRDLGLQLSGSLLRIRKLNRVEYAVGVFNGAGINVKDDNHYKDTAARIVLHPLAHILLAGNYYKGAIGIKKIGRERAGGELAYTRGPLSLAAEYIWGHDGATHRRGWYSQGAYRLSRQWEGTFRFDKFDPRQPTSTLTASNNYVFGSNFYLNSYVKLQANYDRQTDLLARRVNNIFLLQTQVQFGAEKERK